MEGSSLRGLKRTALFVSGRKMLLLDKQMCGQNLFHFPHTSVGSRYQCGSRFPTSVFSTSFSRPWPLWNHTWPSSSEESSFCWSSFCGKRKVVPLFQLWREVRVNGFTSGQSLQFHRNFPVWFQAIYKLVVKPWVNFYPFDFSLQGLAMAKKHIAWIGNINHSRIISAKQPLIIILLTPCFFVKLFLSQLLTDDLCFLEVRM